MANASDASRRDTKGDKASPCTCWWCNPDTRRRKRDRLRTEVEISEARAAVEV